MTTFNLDTIVPWGRNFDEYARMFSLTSRELDSKIIDCGGGPSSFNCEMKRQGRNVTSCDPLYAYTADEIRRRIDQTSDEVMEQTIKNKANFLWKFITSPDELLRIRMSAMQEFLADFEEGKTQGRYVAESLPDVSFKNKQFDLSLSSHFLFLYTNQLSFDFHCKAVFEMVRIAHEVRIFPLVDLENGQKSPYLRKMISMLTEKGCNATIEKVDYEFRRDANEMLKIC